MYGSMFRPGVNISTFRNVYTVTFVQVADPYELHN
jgi:hypothetical protein